MSRYIYIIALPRMRFGIEITQRVSVSLRITRDRRSSVMRQGYTHELCDFNPNRILGCAIIYLLHENIIYVGFAVILADFIRVIFERRNK